MHLIRTGTFYYCTYVLVTNIQANNESSQRYSSTKTTCSKLLDACLYAYTVVQLGIFNSRIYTCIPVMHHAIIHYAPETPGACLCMLMIIARHAYWTNYYFCYSVRFFPIARFRLLVRLTCFQYTGIIKIFVEFIVDI